MFLFATVVTNSLPGVASNVARLPNGQDTRRDRQLQLVWPELHHDYSAPLTVIGEAAC